LRSAPSTCGRITSSRFLVPGAILFFARVARLAPAAAALRRFAWAVLVGAIAGAVAFTAWLVLDARQCTRCSPMRDYTAAAQEIARAGAADALIIGDDFEAVGNLLAMLPDARGWALLADQPSAVPADAFGRGCALVWTNRVGATAAAPIPSWAQALLRTPPGIGEVHNVASPIRRLLGGEPRLFWLSFTVVAPQDCLASRNAAAR
jgi:hypothetical protein